MERKKSEREREKREEVRGAKRGFRSLSPSCHRSPVLSDVVGRITNAVRLRHCHLVACHRIKELKEKEKRKGK
jgi:(p)ppGpp synthase/HD superfamily hydrolase